VTATATALRAARNAVAALIGLLCTVFVLWHGARYSAPTAALAGVLGVAPWVAIGPGLWRGDRRRHVAATLLTVPYLGYGLMELLANPGARLWASAVVLLAFAEFVALIAFLRLSRPSIAAPT
jgi:uncharacterized membrane protein